MPRPKCDECDCTDFYTVRVRSKPKQVEYVPASEYVKGLGESRVVPAMIVYRTYRLVCRNCGAGYSYSEAGGWGEDGT